MGKLYTSQELVDSLRLETFTSDTQAEGTDDANLLTFLNKAMRTVVAPKLSTLRENYLVEYEHIPLVAGQKRYSFPKRAMGNTLHSVAWVDASPTPTDRQAATKISPVDDLSYRLDTGFVAYYLANQEIVLAGLEPDPGGYLEVGFYFEPGELVLAANYRIVATVTPATKTITTTVAIPGSWTDTLDYEVHSARPGASPKVWEAGVSSASGSTIVFDDEIDGTGAYGRRAIEVGDYVCLAGEAASPQGIPRNLHPLIVIEAATMVLRALGDQEAWQIARREASGIWKELEQLQDKRVKTESSTMSGRKGVWGSRHRRRRATWGNG